MKVYVVAFLVGALMATILSGLYGQNDIILSDQASEEPRDGKVSNFGDNADESINAEPFMATHEWQVVKKNQAIPAGLHVRMNFETGITEAKLMNEEENKTPKKQELRNAKEKIREAVENKKLGPKIIIADDVIKKQEGDFANEKLVFTKSHLKQALNDFKDKIGTKDIEHITWSDDALRETLDQENIVEKKKHKFRTMDEIRADLEKHMHWNIKTDVQIMQDIIRHLRSENVSKEEKGAALDTLEEYAHQIDNGRDLEKIGGLKLVVDLLNDPDEMLQKKAANVIGAAAQSNKEVQESVFNHGGLNFLIKMLGASKETLTQKKGLYAVSAVIRGDHHVQSEFVKLGGLKSILRILKESSVNSLKVKAVTLLYDLIVEQDEVMQKMVQAGKKSPSERSPLLNSLIDADWCDLLLPLLKTKDFDAKEKVIQALVVSVNGCSTQLSKHMKDLQEELNGLEENIKVEDDDDFKGYLRSLKEQLEKSVIEPLKLVVS